MRRARRGDEGAGTVLVLTAVAVVGLSALLVMVLATADGLRHRAGVAADAAALAAALRVTETGAACPAARALAEENAAALLRCDVEGAVVTVTVEVAPPPWESWLGAARLNARAGPAETFGEKSAPVDGAS